MTAKLLLLLVVLIPQDDLFPEDSAPANNKPTLRSAWVSTAELDVLVEPDDTALIASRLRRGQRLEVRGQEKRGWLPITPPPDSYSWIERSAIEELGDDRARVVVRAAAVRPGADEASLPAGIWTVVRRGDFVRLLDRPTLVFTQPDEQRRVWYAIAPPPDEVRYVRADGITWTDPEKFSVADGESARSFDFLDAPETRQGRRSILASRRLEPLGPDFLRVGPTTPELGLPSALSQSLSRIESAHRAILSDRLENWSLNAVRHDYQALLAQANEPVARQAIESRLMQLERQDAVARTARELAEAIERARRIDSEVTTIHNRLDAIAAGVDAPFELQGLLQSTSTLVDGRPAFILIDEQGKTSAYLLMTPGVSATPFVAAHVGVRGDSRYHPVLKTRVITVRELVRIDDAP